MATCKPHAIMISLPFQGHMNPMVNLALKLASKGLTVTFAHLEFVHRKLSEARCTGASHEFDVFSQARKSGLDIRYTTISDTLPLEFDRSNRGEYWLVLYRDFPAKVDEFVQKAIQGDPSLLPFLVADTCSAWLAAIAGKYNLVSVSLWTEPALVFSLIYHSELLKEHGHFPCKDEAEEDINYLPGVETINTRDIMPYMKESKHQGLTCQTLLLAFEEVKKVDFILHNTVQELESGTLSALNDVQPTYAIGPIIFSNNVSANVTKSLLPESDCTSWLNSKAPGSVLYVSFGSIVDVNKQDVLEIANGLLLSEVNFIWVMRGDTNVLPNGFQDVIKEKGLIIPWCDQVRILSNPAIGGFLTHCGWNSILESIWSGVPTICYPVTYEQPTNRKLLVDDWKIGIDLYEKALVHREKVAEKIRNFMNRTCSDGLEKEIKKISATFHNAVEIGGSSDSNLDRFITDLKSKLLPKTLTSGQA